MEVLKLKKATMKGNFFESEKGKYILRSVDREYEGSVKKPCYYLSRFVGNDCQFISGFFKTKEENVFSYDEKNEIGMKVFHKAIFKEQGKEIVLN